MKHVSCRLWGKCWGNPADPVRLVVKLAGQSVFSGPVPTSGDAPDARQTAHHEVLCTWSIDTLTAGVYPVEITATGGHASINNILFNNIVSGRYVHPTPDFGVVPDAGTSDSRSKDQSFWPDWMTTFNSNTLTDEEFLGLYGFARNQAPPPYLEYIDVAAEDTWVDGNFNLHKKNGAWCDGKTNVKLNGVAWPPDPPYTHPYERNYFFENGDTLSFDYLIEWNIT